METERFFLHYWQDALDTAHSLFLDHQNGLNPLFIRFLLTRQIVRSRHSRRCEDGSKEA